MCIGSVELNLGTFITELLAFHGQQNGIIASQKTSRKSTEYKHLTDQTKQLASSATSQQKQPMATRPELQDDRKV